MLVHTIAGCDGEKCEVFCSFCGLSMGWFTGDEIRVMLLDKLGAVCFDCDGPASMVMPLQLVGLDFGGPSALRLGELWFSMDFSMLAMGNFCRLRDDEWYEKVRVASLSSSTYLSTVGVDPGGQSE